MSQSDRSPRAAVAHAAATRAELWTLFATVVFVAILGGALVALAAQYRSDWIAAQQVQTDNASAIHRLMFRD